MSATAGQAADGVRSQADRFGIEPGMVVMEMGYDDDVDEDLRDALIDRLLDRLLDGTHPHLTNGLQFQRKKRTAGSIIPASADNIL